MPRSAATTLTPILFPHLHVALAWGFISYANSRPLFRGLLALGDDDDGISTLAELLR